jgi:hypothetical protein
LDVEIICKKPVAGVASAVAVYNHRIIGINGSHIFNVRRGWIGKCIAGSMEIDGIVPGIKRSENLNPQTSVPGSKQDAFFAMLTAKIVQEKRRLDQQRDVDLALYVPKLIFKRIRQIGILPA